MGQLDLGIVRDPSIISHYFNKNLLDNWYFVGGGTGRNFPINQKGASSYSVSSGTDISIDRWCLASGVTATLSDDYITVDNNIYQLVGKFSDFLGKTITLSLLNADGDLFVGTVTLPTTAPSSWTTYLEDGTLRIAWDSNRLRIQFRQLSGTKRNLVACKLEYGSEQTLCHNEGTVANPVWVLNEIPDYDLELLKCQLHYPITKIPSYYNDSYIQTNSTQYALVGNICTLYLAIRISKSTISADTVLLTGLPKPIRESYFVISVWNAELPSKITTNGELVTSDTWSTVSGTWVTMVLSYFARTEGMW